VLKPAQATSAAWRPGQFARLALALVVAATLQAESAQRATADEPIPLSPEAIREFPTEPDPTDLVFGSEGGVWYDNYQALFRVTPTGTETGDFTVKYGANLGLPEVTTYLASLTLGSDGAMWFIESGYPDEPAQLLGRITPAGKTSEYDVEEPGSNIAGLAAGPRASIWFTVDEAYGATKPIPGAIKRIAGKGEVETFLPPTGDDADRPSQSFPGKITAGPEGDMWFIDNGKNDEGHSLVGRITPAGEINEYPLPEALGGSESLTVGPGGDIWVLGALNILYRMKPNGEVTTLKVPRISGEALGLTAGPEGNLWYLAGTYFDASALGRVTPAGEATLFALPAASGWNSPMLGPDGELWFVGESSIVAVRPPLAPTNAVAPAIVGEAVEGQALTVSPGTWQNYSTLAFRWALCNTMGAACEPLFGQEGHSVALLPFAVGHTLAVTVTASGPGGTATSTSAPSPVVQPAPVVRPAPVVDDVHSPALNVMVTPAPTLSTTMKWQFGWSHRGTKVKSLRLHSVPAGGDVEVRCHGRTCPFKVHRLQSLAGAALRRCKDQPCLSAQGGEVELSSMWQGRRLKAGDVVEVAVIRADYRGKLFSYVIRRSGPPQPPAIACLSPGSTETTQSC
jgi:virginiamycin B lyase